MSNGFVSTKTPSLKLATTCRARKILETCIAAWVWVCGCVYSMHSAV
jgi:hypothetical protein